MLTVVIETRNQAEPLARTLASLVSGAVEGMVREVLVHDLGSTDGTERVAEHAGCQMVAEGALRESLARAKGEWLLFLEPGSRLADGWMEAVRDHVEAGAGAARFSLAWPAGSGFVQRLWPVKPLAAGLLIAKAQAIALIRTGEGAAHVAGRIRSVRLGARIVPAVAR